MRCASSGCEVPAVSAWFLFLLGAGVWVGDAGRSKCGPRPAGHACSPARPLLPPESHLQIRDHDCGQWEYGGTQRCLKDFERACVRCAPSRTRFVGELDLVLPRARRNGVGLDRHEMGRDARRSSSSSTVRLSVADPRRQVPSPSLACTTTTTKPTTCFPLPLLSLPLSLPGALTRKELDGRVRSSGSHCATGRRGRHRGDVGDRGARRDRRGLLRCRRSSSSGSGSWCGFGCGCTGGAGGLRRRGLNRESGRVAGGRGYAGGGRRAENKVGYGGRVGGRWWEEMSEWVELFFQWANKREETRIASCSCVDWMHCENSDIMFVWRAGKPASHHPERQCPTQPGDDRVHSVQSHICIQTSAMHTTKQHRNASVN